MRVKAPHGLLLGLSMSALMLAMQARAQEATAPQPPTALLDYDATQTITLREATPSATLHAAPEKIAPAPAEILPLVETPEPSLPSILSAPVAIPAPDASSISVAIKQSLEDLAKEPARNLAVKREREAIAAFYAARAYAPLWLEQSAWTNAAKTALTRLEHADEDGLSLKSAALPALSGATDGERAVTELALSMAIVTYGRQASGSRIDPQSIDKLITEKPDVADAARILSTVAAAPDADAALRSFNPTQSGYLALRDKLAEVRREKPKSIDQVASGPVLKVGMKDPRVPVIRARFGLDPQPLAESSDALVYDTRVASAVAFFQRSFGLPSNGQLTPRTIAALSGGDPARLEAEIIANMERWRWRARGEAPERIEVNIPDFSVRVIRDNAEFYRARVIVGKPTTQTPIFSNRMQFIEVNPYWNVPDSIIKKEMMPKLADDPTYLQRMGYEVSTAPNGRMIVRQPPGERNALGNIKFMFPNQHAVYLHDTPSRGLFANDTRAYSHGCVRLDKPFKFAEVVLGAENGWTEERARRLVGGKNQTIPLPHAIDIHIGYYTAFVDNEGKLQLREDIYGYSRKVRAALGLEA